jgi:hypothetical protein
VTRRLSIIHMRRANMYKLRILKWNMLQKIQYTLNLPTHIILLHIHRFLLKYIRHTCYISHPFSAVVVYLFSCWICQYPHTHSLICLLPLPRKRATQFVVVRSSTYFLCMFVAALGRTMYITRAGAGWEGKGLIPFPQRNKKSEIKTFSWS